jgi:predicted MPP superfamily phosphohydrolase
VELERNGEKITLAGCLNWSLRSNKQRWGDIDKTIRGANPNQFALLMTHDPSHWEELVRKNYPWIDLTFSGHTHGFQCGIETNGIRWSPSQWLYRQWAGLYSVAGQQIYVNRGFGFVGYPGRLGIWPEITYITLRKG